MPQWRAKNKQLSDIICNGRYRIWFGVEVVVLPLLGVLIFNDHNDLKFYLFMMVVSNVSYDV